MSADRACIWCNEDEEDAKHALIGCKFLWEMWFLCFNWWGLQFALLNSISDLLNQVVFTS
ncbi:hypothetical protein Ancab_026373, partial [Ancistrocladus abbreviatus]